MNKMEEPIPPCRPETCLLYVSCYIRVVAGISAFKKIYYIRKCKDQVFNDIYYDNLMSTMCRIMCLRTDFKGKTCSELKKYYNEVNIFMNRNDNYPNESPQENYYRHRLYLLLSIGKCFPKYLEEGFKLTSIKLYNGKITLPNGKTKSPL